MTDLANIRRLAGMRESSDQEDDEELRLADAKMAREQQIVALITKAFRWLGLTIRPDGYGIDYDETYERLAVVVLEDEPDGYSLKQLLKLYDSGLSDEFTVAANSSNHIEIHFKVSPALDHTV